MGCNEAMHSSLSTNELRFECRRVTCDRRQRPTRSLHVHGLQGRRKMLRRKEDRNNNTDWFESHVMLIALSIVVFCIADFIFTSIIIANGGIELNLLMKETMSMGMEAFFVYKYSLTCLSLILLVAHQNYRLFHGIRVKHILYGFSVSYLSLLVYEVILLTKIF